MPAAGPALTLLMWVWLGAELYTMLIGRRFDAGDHPLDRGSYWVVLGTTGAAILAGYVVRALGFGVFAGGVQYLGLALMLGGLLFRQWAVHVLGQHFTVLVTIAPGQHLVSRGPYRRLRHPAYTGALLTLAGLPLALGTWVGLPVVLVPCFLSFAYRAHVEEQALLAAFGDEYRAYRRRTWRFFPGF